jgi:hypothetical protein
LNVGGESPSFAGIRNQLKGGDPVSHCHSPRAHEAAWIIVSAIVGTASI